MTASLNGIGNAIKTRLRAPIKTLFAARRRGKTPAQVWQSWQPAPRRRLATAEAV